MTTSKSLGLWSISFTIETSILNKCGSVFKAFALKFSGKIIKKYVSSLLHDVREYNFVISADSLIDSIVFRIKSSNELDLINFDRTVVPLSNVDNNNQTINSMKLNIIL